MNASQIVSSFRSACGEASTNDLSDSKAVEILNRAYYKVVNTLRKNVDEDFMSDVFLTNLVTGKYEYSFDTRWDDANNRTPITKVTKVFVKYGEKFVQAKPFALSDQGYDDTILETLVSTASPIYKVVDYSIFLFPTPLTDVTNWLKVYWYYDPIPLTINTTEANIWVPPSHHDMIISHMRYMYYEHIQQLDKRTASYNDMLIAEARMIGELSDRISEPSEMTMPDLTFFK